MYVTDDFIGLSAGNYKDVDVLYLQDETWFERLCALVKHQNRSMPRLTNAAQRKISITFSTN